VMMAEITFSSVATGQRGCFVIRAGNKLWHFSMERRSEKMAGATGLEPAASCVTGRRSNQPIRNALSRADWILNLAHSWHTGIAKNHRKTADCD
jgi:hypothetical protein